MRFGQDFPQSVQPVLEALEEQVVLMRLLGEAAGPDEVSVRIGHENSLEGLSATSVVSVGYGEEEAVAPPRHRRSDPDGLPGHASARCGRWRGTSAGSWRSPDGGPRHGPVRRSSASAATPPRTRSSGRTAGSPASCTPTSTRTRQTQERFKEVTAAYEVLSDPAKRERYDLGGDPFGNGGFGGAGAGFGFGDIMDAFFGGTATRGPRSRRRRGQDALIRIEIELAEAAFGSTRDPPGRHRRGLPELHRREAPRPAPSRPPATSATAAATCSRCSARSSVRS